MRLLIRLTRIYTPFICILAAFINGLLFIQGPTELPAIYMLSALTGNSILIDLYILINSKRMCIWYKLTVVCLLLIQVFGFTYDCLGIGYSLYTLFMVLISALGIMFFLIFKIFYRVTNLFLCIDRYSPKS